MTIDLDEAKVESVLTWLVVNTLAWAAGLWASQAALTLFFQEPVIEPAVSTAVIAATSGLVAGGITGLALIWIARQPEMLGEGAGEAGR